MAKLVAPIEAPMFRRLRRVEEDERGFLPPHRERIDFLGFYRQGENAYTFGFQQVHDVLDRQHAQTPDITQLLGSRLRIPLATEIWEFWCRQHESPLDPRVEKQRQRPRAECRISLRGSHSLQSTEARDVRSRLVKIGTKKELAWETQSPC